MSPYRSDFLFARGSIMTGLGSVLNLPGNYYRYNFLPTAEEADAVAAACDWMAVGRDIANAVLQVQHGSARVKP